ncbi:MAG: DNA/RNA non-specific endonuclease [Rikenellaceae bacterium]|nr:DNA/RNA non-specific endonuclease [Rikenellaceae bacterium]
MRIFEGIGLQAIVLLLCGSLLVGCTKDEIAVQLSAELSSESVSASSTSLFLNIDANSDWTLSVNYKTGGEGWCTPTLTSGKGDANVVLNLSANAADIARVAEIAVYSGDKSARNTLTQAAKTGGGENPGTGNLKWLEIPSGGGNTNTKIVTHSIELSGKSVRNYTLMYDKNERIAYWVAYPHNSIYIGSASRTDAWQPDPDFATADQAYLYNGITGYDRGHQIPSADRTCTTEANTQTFYFTNMTPQLGVLNQQMWASLEGQVRGWMSSCDTLYVVTGAILRTAGGNETVNYAVDKIGGLIAVPNYYYKVLLRLKNQKYDAIGFWFEHRAYGSGNATALQTKSVDQIEVLTGFNFFANLSETIQNEAEAKWAPADWNL